MPARGVFAFGPFRLDPASRRLTRDGTDVPIQTRQLDLLIALVQAGGAILTKDELIRAVWASRLRTTVS